MAPLIGRTLSISGARAPSGGSGRGLVPPRVSPWKRRTTRAGSRGATGGRAASATAWMTPRASYPPLPCSSASTSTGRGRRSAGSRPGRWRRATSSSAASSGPSRRFGHLRSSRSSRPHVAMHPRGHHRGRRERSGRVARRGRVPAARQARRRGRRRSRRARPARFAEADDIGRGRHGNVGDRSPAPVHSPVTLGGPGFDPTSGKDGWDGTRAAAAAIRDGARARAAKADAAFAKMRRGAAALREAVRMYDASFEQTSAAGGSSVRPGRTGLAGISPSRLRRRRGSEVEGGRPRDRGRDGGGGEGRGRARGGDGGVDVGGERTGRRRWAGAGRPSGDASATTSQSGNQPRRGPSAGCNSRRTSRATRVRTAISPLTRRPHDRGEKPNTGRAS